YRRDLDDYGRFLAGRRTGFEHAGAAGVRAFLVHLDDQGLAARSAARRLSAVRQFHRYLFGAGVRADDPTRPVDGPRPPARLPKVLSEADVGRLIGTAREAAERPGLAPLQRARAARLHALLELLYATGLRVSELVSLPAAAVKRDARMFMVRGKGGHERI